GKATKISLIAIRILQPTVVDAIEVHHFRLQALRLQYGGKAQNADRRKFAHDTGSFRFAYGTAIELVGCGGTDETNLHDCHLFGRRMNDSGSTSDQIDPLSSMSV